MAPPAVAVLTDRSDCASCPAELALEQARQAIEQNKAEAEARQAFDRELSSSADRLAEEMQKLGPRVEGLHVVTSDLQRTVDSIEPRIVRLETATGKLEAGLFRISNLKYWIALVLAGYELAKSEGVAGVVSAIVKALQ